jgi:hypothetical protein
MDETAKEAPHKVIPFQPSSSKTADDHANAETERRNKQNAWCDALLAKLPSKLPLSQQIEQATTIDELRNIVFDPLSENDPNSVEVDLAIQNAFYPPDGTKRDDCFKGMTERRLKRILRNRFNEKKTLSRTCNKCGHTISSAG